MGAFTHEANLPNAKWNMPGQHAASSQFKRVSIYFKPFSSTILQNWILSRDKGSYIDFTTVYAFSKHAQIIGDFLEELKPVPRFL